MTTVTDLQKTDQLIFSYGDFNIIDCGVRTGKTYWAVNNLQQFTRDGKLNRILYLVGTTAEKDYIIASYDNCIEADFLWENEGHEWEGTPNKIGIMCYQGLSSRFLRETPTFLNYVDVICWDECDGIFDFAADEFVKARRTDFAKKNVSNAEVLNIIQQYSSKKAYSSLIFLGVWQKLIEEGRIMCIGLSASPERSYMYYKSLVSASYQGKLEAGYRMANDIYFCNVADHVRQLHPEIGKGYWCFSPFIEPNKALAEIARKQGFHPIELHSVNNLEKPMDEEQLRVYNMVITTGMIPPEYDFVIVNKALARGITILDQRFTHLIVDSVNQAERIQAARQTFNYQRHLKVLAPKISDEYLNKWLPLEKCRELAEELAVPEIGSNRVRILTWNRLRQYLPEIGYEIEQKRKRIDGKPIQVYRITGEWHDVEIVDNSFLALADAHGLNDEEIKREEE